jgi:arsenite methyltransferase
MIPDRADLREKVRLTYGTVAEEPRAELPFHIGRGVAERAGYIQEMLSIIPAASVESFAGIS